MVQKIWNEIGNGQEVRKNLSALRELVKDAAKRKKCYELVEEQSLLMEQLLESEDAKTRKNAALLVGDLQMNSMQHSLWMAYEKEETWKELLADEEKIRTEATDPADHCFHCLRAGGSGH